MVTNRATVAHDAYTCAVETTQTVYTNMK